METSNFELRTSNFELRKEVRGQRTDEEENAERSTTEGFRGCPIAAGERSTFNRRAEIRTRFSVVADQAAEEED
jgi:porphobilinogen deaminase